MDSLGNVEVVLLGDEFVDSEDSLELNEGWGTLLNPIGRVFVLGPLMEN